MAELLGVVQDTPIPNLLVLAGISLHLPGHRRWTLRQSDRAQGAPALDRRYRSGVAGGWYWPARVGQPAARLWGCLSHASADPTGYRDGANGRPSDRDQRSRRAGFDTGDDRTSRDPTVRPCHRHSTVFRGGWGRPGASRHRDDLAHHTRRQHTVAAARLERHPRQLFLPLQSEHAAL